MANFIVKNRFSRLMPLSDESVHKMMQEAKPSLILLTKSESRLRGIFKTILEDFPELNAIYKNVRQTENSKDASQLMDMIGIRPSEAPVLVMLPFKPPQKGIIPKHKTKRLARKQIRKFIEDGLAGKLEIYLKSEETKQDPERAYEQVTLDNFDATVLAPNRYFLLGLHVVHENIPEDMNIIFQNLGLSVAELGLGSQLAVGTCNIYQNEISGKVDVTSIPQIVLVDREDKSKRILYNGKPIEREIKKFIEEHTGLPIGNHKLSLEAQTKKMNESLQQIMAGEVDL